MYVWNYSYELWWYIYILKKIYYEEIHYHINWTFSRNILSHYGKLLGLDSKRVPANTAASQYAEALAKAWNEYNNPRLFFLEKLSYSLYSASAFGSMLYLDPVCVQSVLHAVMQFGVVRSRSDGPDFKVGFLLSKSLKLLLKSRLRS